MPSSADWLDSTECIIDLIDNSLLVLHMLSNVYVWNAVSKDLGGQQYLFVFLSQLKCQTIINMK